MKKFHLIIITLLTVLLCITGTSFAEESEEQKKFFVGVGLSGGYENFDSELPRFGDTRGPCFRVGYYFIETLALELEYNYLPGFDNDRYGKSEIDIRTIIAALKYDAHSAKSFDLYITLGLGHMEVDVSMGPNLTIPVMLREDGSHTGPCVKIGFGIDYFVLENLSIKCELVNILGMNDVDKYKFNNWLLGINFFF